jgi:hypothetical protein
MLSRERPAFALSNGMTGSLKAITISAKATPITNPKFLERAKKLEATPTFSQGKEPMIALLLAGLKRLIPMPRTTCLQRMSTSLATGFKRVKEKMVKEVRVKPMVAGILTPTRSENLPPIGAMTITVRATGKISIPTLDGEYSKIFWRKKGMTKVWAALIQKERKLAPREEVKSRLLKSLRSTKGEGDRSSTLINRLNQSRLEKNPTPRRGVSPLLI